MRQAFRNLYFYENTRVHIYLRLQIRLGWAKKDLNSAIIARRHHQELPLDAIAPDYFSALFPYPLGTASVWLSDRLFPLYPQEESTVAAAVATRRIEFAAGRHCARLAMSQLGRPACALPAGQDRAPLWPEGLIGSITHSAGLCAAVVATQARYRAVGIDTEPVGAVPIDLTQAILRPDETADADRSRQSGDADWLTLHFCLKEAAYKAIYPLCRRFMDFQEMLIRIVPERQEFRAEPQIPLPNGLPDLRGKYLVRENRIYSACWIA